jgi:hypothetical protein
MFILCKSTTASLTSENFPHPTSAASSESKLLEYSTDRNTIHQIMEDSQLPTAITQALQQPGATIVQVVCYHEPDPGVKRDEFLQIVRNAGCHVFYITELAADFMYVMTIATCTV